MPPRLRGIDSVDELNTVPEKVKPEEMKLARQVIQTFEQPLNLANYKDEYREGLQRIIDAKIAGEEVVATSTEAPPKVVNLMDALRKSLDSVSAKKKQPAKAAIAKAPGEEEAGLGIQNSESGIWNAYADSAYGLVSIL